MNTSIVTRLASATLLLALCASLAGAKAASTAVPAAASFGGSVNNNPAGDAVYADLAGAYKDGTYTDSLGAIVTGNSRVTGGDYFLRTVDYTGTASTNIRGIYLDFK